MAPTLNPESTQLQRVGRLPRTLRRIRRPSRGPSQMSDNTCEQRQGRSARAGRRRKKGLERGEEAKVKTQAVVSMSSPEKPDMVFGWRSIFTSAYIFRRYSGCLVSSLRLLERNAQTEIVPFSSLEQIAVHGQTHSRHERKSRGRSRAAPSTLPETPLVARHSQLLRQLRFMSHSHFRKSVV